MSEGLCQNVHFLPCISCGAQAPDWQACSAFAAQQAYDAAFAAQVEGLCSMVTGVEELVAKAERHCTAMQVQLSNMSLTMSRSHEFHMHPCMSLLVQKVEDTQRVM